MEEGCSSVPDNQQLRERIREILDRGYFMHLGTVDGSGPWVCTVIYIHDDQLRLFWMSDPDVRHSRAIAAQPHVAAAITVSGPKEPNLGVQITGEAVRLDGPRHDLAVKHLVKRGHPPPHETNDVLQGDAWYELRPTAIDIIDEEHFGFEEQHVVLDG